MAIYEGARQRTIVLPRAPSLGVNARALPRRRLRSPVRARRRSARAGVVLGGIVIAFVCAFFSLAQDVRLSATGVEIDRLTADKQRLEAQAIDLRSELSRLGKAPAIRKQAIDAGLGPLAEPLVVVAREPGKRDAG